MTKNRNTPDWLWPTVILLTLLPIWISINQQENNTQDKIYCYNNKCYEDKNLIKEKLYGELEKRNEILTKNSQEIASFSESNCPKNILDPETPYCLKELSNKVQTYSTNLEETKKIITTYKEIIPEQEEYLDWIKEKETIIESAQDFINSTNKTFVFCSQENNINSEQKRYCWNYKEKTWILEINLSKEDYDYYKSQPRNDYYIIWDKSDDKAIKSLTEILTKLGNKNNLTEEELPYLAVSFIQSLPYTSDKISTGFDDYTRYTYETLYENGGDCEDTSLLASAILKEMGYSVILIAFEDHVGIGIKCFDDISGYRYNYVNQDYCYLETTAEGWDIGKLPEKYQEQKAKLIPA